MWEGVRDWTKTATYWPPQPLWTSLCVVLVLLGCSTGGLPHLVTNGSDLQTQSGVPNAPSAGWWLSLPHLFSNSSDLQLIGGPEGPFCWLSLPHLLSNFSGLQLTDFLSSTSYIMVQSPSQSLEWHVWSSSNGNNCHEVHRSLSSGASVYECTMGLLPCPIFFSQARLRDFSS